MKTKFAGLELDDKISLAELAEILQVHGVLIKANIERQKEVTAAEILKDC